MVTKKQKDLSQLVYQDKKSISKYCSKDNFNPMPLTLEEHLVKIFGDKRVQKALKTQFLAEAKVGLTAAGAMRIELQFGNDEIHKRQQDLLNLLDIFEDIKQAVKEINNVN